MKNRGRWFWYLAVICMAEAAAAFLISGYVFHDGYYFFESSFEKSRYVERNLGNSVYDLIGVAEGWRFLELGWHFSCSLSGMQVEGRPNWEIGNKINCRD